MGVGIGVLRPRNVGDVCGTWNREQLGPGFLECRCEDGYVSTNCPRSVRLGLDDKQKWTFGEVPIRARQISEESRAGTWFRNVCTSVQGMKSTSKCVLTAHEGGGRYGGYVGAMAGEMREIWNRVDVVASWKLLDGEPVHVEVHKVECQGDGEEGELHKRLSAESLA